MFLYCIINVIMCVSILFGAAMVSPVGEFLDVICFGCAAVGKIFLAWIHGSSVVS